MDHTCVEVCPHCDTENEFEHDVTTQGFVTVCKECEREIFLCDECLHLEDNPNMKCDWENGRCFRGKCKPHRTDI